MKLSTWGRPASKPGFGWQAYVFQNRVNQPGSWNFRFDFRRPVLYRRYPLHTTPALLGAECFHGRREPDPSSMSGRTHGLLGFPSESMVVPISVPLGAWLTLTFLRMPMCMPSLESGERDRLWEFEEGHCGHPLRNMPSPNRISGKPPTNQAFRFDSCTLVQRLPFMMFVVHLKLSHNV